MVLRKYLWGPTAAIVAVAGILMFAGGAWAWNGSAPCTDIELDGLGDDLTVNQGPALDFVGGQLVQCFLMGQGLNKTALEAIPPFRTTMEEIVATQTTPGTPGGEDVATLKAIVEKKLVGTIASPGLIRLFIRANNPAGGTAKITFKTNELSASTDDTILVARALSISGVNEGSIGLASDGLNASVQGTAGLTSEELLGEDGFFHFEFAGLDPIMAALGIANPNLDPRSIAWTNPYKGVVSAGAASGNAVKGRAGKVTFAVKYHGLSGTDVITLGGSGADNGNFTPSHIPATLSNAGTGELSEVTLTLAFTAAASYAVNTPLDVKIIGKTAGGADIGDALALTLQAREAGIQSVALDGTPNVAAGTGGTFGVAVTVGYVPDGTYEAVIVSNVAGWSGSYDITVSGLLNTTGVRKFTIISATDNTVGTGTITGIQLRLRSKGANPAFMGQPATVPDFTAYNPQITATDGWATVEFAKEDHFLTYTNGATFKITDVETPEIWVKDSTKAGRTNAWKPVSITYKQKNGTFSVTYKTTTGASWTSIDKGLKIGTKSTDANGDETNTSVALGFDQICADDWEVTARMMNRTYGLGYGRWTESATNMTINRRLLSASGISMTVTLGDDVYNGKEKKPKIVLEDGIRLVEDVHYEIKAEDNDAEYKDAGTYIVTVSGKGPYQRKKSASFVIQKGTLKFDVATPGMTYKFTKPYDATTAVDTSDYKVDIKFLDGNDVELTTPLTFGTDYTVKNLKYNTAPVGTDKIVSADVALVNTDNTKNWKLAATKFEAGKQVITKAVPSAENVSFKLGSRTFSLPASIPMDGKLGKTLEAEWKSPFVSSGAKFTITYPENWPTGAKDSLKIDDYEILLSITEGANTESVKDWAVGTLTVRDPSLPNIDADTGYIPANREAFYYTGKSAVIGVKAEKPEGGKGTLSYQWYLVVEDSTADRTLSGKTSSTLTVNTAVNAATDFNYYVVVTYTANNEQLPKSVKSDNIKVTGYPKPVSLAGAVIQPTLTYTYDGTEQAVPYSDFTVTLGAQTLNYGEDFTYKGARNNKFAGDGIITIKGINAYEDSAVGTFAINKKAVDILTDISPRYSVVFNGQPQTLAVPTNSPLTGLGAVTVLIGDSLWSTRTNAGEWDVSIAIAEGQNFEALDTTPLPQTFRIRKAIPDTSMFTFSVPAETPFTGEPVTVAAPVAKGLGLLYSATASNVILYNGSAVAPSRLGTYTVELSVLGDANFSSYVIPLGRMTIYDPTISVAEGSREIPNGSVATEAAVAPVKVSGAGVTFGPNPVGAGSSVSIFWNGSKPVSGKLAVFTEMGKKVETVKVSGTNKIGTWNAAKAPAGTYLVKGVLKAKDGTKVTVNSVVSVGK